MAQRAFIGAADGVALSTASTAWYAPLGCGPSPGQIVETVEANAQVTHRGANATLKSLYIRLSANGRSTATTVTIRKNGSSTALAISVPGATTGNLSNLTDTVTLTDGDTYCVEVATGTGTGAMNFVSITLAMETTGQCFQTFTGQGSQALTTASVTRYLLPVGPLGALSSTESTYQTKALMSGTLANLNIHVTANARTTSVTAKSRINGADGAQTLTIGAGTTGRFADTTNTDTIVAGDLFVPAVVTSTGTESITFAHASFSFTPDTAGRSQLQSKNASTVLAAATTRYAQILGRSVLGTVEGFVQVIAPFRCRLSQLTAKTSANSSTADVAVQIRINGATGNQNATVTAAGTGHFTDATNSDIVNAGDMICVMVSGGVTGSVTFNGFSLLVEELQAYSVAADVGSFTEAGQGANFQRTYRLPSDAGSFALSGQSANLIRPLPFSADAGAFSLTGQAATLLRGYSLLSAVGSFVETGQSAGLQAVRTLTASVGSFTQTGQSANLLSGRSIGADVGGFTLAGQAASLAATGSYGFLASAGSFAVAGQDAAFGRSVVGEVGAISLSGQDVSFSYGRTMVAEPGAFLTTGREVTWRLRRARRSVFVLG